MKNDFPLRHVLKERQRGNGLLKIAVSSHEEGRVKRTIMVKQCRKALRKINMPVCHVVNAAAKLENYKKLS